MRLLLFHPGAAKIDCRDCAQFIYDLETGERKTYKSGPERVELPCIRPKFVPTPCEKCPKGNPERAKDLELSRKNWQALSHYTQARAVGLSEAERGDAIVRRNFGIIDGIMRQFERQQQARLNAVEIARIMPK